MLDAVSRGLDNGSSIEKEPWVWCAPGANIFSCVGQGKEFRPLNDWGDWGTKLGRT